MASGTRATITDAAGDRVQIRRLGTTNEVLIAIEEDDSSEMLSVLLTVNQAREVANGLLMIVSEIEGL